MHDKPVYCVVYYDGGHDHEERCLKLSCRDEAFEVARAIHGLLYYNDRVKVIEGQPVVIWDSEVEC